MLTDTISIINYVGLILGCIQSFYTNITLGGPYKMKTLKPGAIQVGIDHPCLPLG